MTGRIEATSVIAGDTAAGTTSKCLRSAGGQDGREQDGHPQAGRTLAGRLQTGGGLAGRGLVILVLSAWLAPLALIGVWAIAGQWRFPAVLPTRWTVRGLALVAESRSGIPHALFVSAAIAVTVCALAVLVGFPAGRALGVYRFRGRTLARIALLAPVVIPGLAVTLGLQVFFIRLGLAGTAVGVVFVHLMPTVPYTATLLGAAFANLDLDYERQARALGVPGWRVFLFVTVPLIRPALAAAALFAFLISWSDYILTLLVGAGHVKTLPILLFAAIGSSDTTAAATLALVIVVPATLAVIAIGRLLGRDSGAGLGMSMR
jgi:putative spermidine/putrescine transport system permease protein